MITIFNRKEIYLTYKTADLNRVQDALDSQNMEYIVRSGNNVGRMQARGVPLPNPELVYEYKVYVHRRDEEKAKYILKHCQ